MINRKVPINDIRNWIIFIAISLASMNWLNYTLLKSTWYTIQFIFTLNFFLYFFESSYFMYRALFFVKDKKILLRRMVIMLGILFVLIYIIVEVNLVIYKSNSKNRYKYTYCHTYAYQFYAIAPCIISITFGSVFLYIKR